MIGTRGRERLSPRELDVVRAVARGRTNAEIAGELFVSPSTVKTHLTNVATKLAVRNRVEVAAWAWENGLVRARPTDGGRTDSLTGCPPGRR